MASYNTIPAAAEDSLLAPKKSNKIKGLVAGAAIAAFVLGAVAATSVTTASPQPTTNFKKKAAAQTAFSSQAKYCMDDYFKVDIGCLKHDGSSYNTLEHPEYVPWNAAGSSNTWDSGAWVDHNGNNPFDYVETQEFLLEHADAKDCKEFYMSVIAPCNTVDIAPKFRAYHGFDGNYLGSIPTGLYSDGNVATIPNLDDNSGLPDHPFALKTSVFLENDDGTVHGNRVLIVSINFKAKTKPANKAHKCVIAKDVTSDGFGITGGEDQLGGDCPLVAPAYECDGQELSLKGSLRNMLDGRPIDIEFQNWATLEVPITNMHIGYVFENYDSKCEALCKWANGEGQLTNHAMECYAKDVYEYHYPEVGPVKIHGSGFMSSGGIWGNEGNWPDWDKDDKTLGDDGHTGYFKGVKIGDAMKRNEWYMLSGVLLIQDQNPVNTDYSLEVHDISFTNPMPRHDGTIIHGGNQPAWLQNVNQISWYGQADGANLLAPYSKIDTSFLMSADDVIHVSADHFLAYHNVVISGSAGGVAILGSYNNGQRDWNNEPYQLTIEGAQVDHVFVARAMMDPSPDQQSAWDNQAGLVVTRSCMENGALYMEATVNNLVVAGLGIYDNGEQVQEINRLFSITANDAAHGNGYCGKGDLAQPPKPYMDLNFYDWYVLGDDKLGSYWEFPSNQCNYLCSGSAKDCTWFVKLDGNKGQCSGTDLCDSMDWNNICPF